MCYCKICQNQAEVNQGKESYDYYNCPNCGMYIIPESTTMNQHYSSNSESERFNYNKLSKYLYYNKKAEINAFIGSEEAFEKYKKANEKSTAFLVTPKTVENWYPKTFSEKIDKILIKLNELCAFDGDYITKDDLIATFFVSDKISKTRKNAGVDIQYEYLINNLVQNDYIVKIDQYYQLTPKGLEKIYTVQKDQTDNKNAFIAMKFGEETLEIRSAIKQAVENAGYIARIMDEIEHNNQIVPEMLYEIENCRFMIAELSNHNNGAYFEAGYGSGCKKQVILVCKDTELINSLHFDVAQQNAVIYNSPNDLISKLEKRIKATIS